MAISRLISERDCENDRVNHLEKELCQSSRQLSKVYNDVSMLVKSTLRLVPMKLNHVAVHSLLF